jgi:hypothetical protein
VPSPPHHPTPSNRRFRSFFVFYFYSILFIYLFI